MKKKDEKKEKPTPKRCVCCKIGVLTVWKGKKMVSCPDPCNCSANRRTAWYSNADEAIQAWNNDVLL